MDAMMIMDSVRFSHILAVTIGLGGSFLADAYVFARLGKPINSGFTSHLHDLHKLVTFALIGMWLSGTALIYIRTGFVPENFSPKLISKIGTVTLLTFNAILIGKIAMPMLEKNIGLSPLDLPTRRKMALALMSGVSTTSWLLALAMGVSKVLAASPWHTFLVIMPAAYLLALFSSAISIFMIDAYRAIYRMQLNPCSCGAAHREDDFLQQLTSMRDDLVARKSLPGGTVSEVQKMTFPNQAKSAR